MKNFFKAAWEKIISSYLYQFIILAGLVLLAFYKVFSFTFHADVEMSYIVGLTGGNFTIMSLIKSHGFISFINYKLFGQNPVGWYVTAVFLHIMVVFALVLFVKNLTKSRQLAFLTGVWFSVSLAWQDIITYGSQQSMYAVIFFFFFVSIYFYKRFRENHQKIISYILAFFFLAIAMPIREIAIVFYPILFFFDIIFYFKYNRKKRLKNNIFSLFRFLIPQIPFIIMSIIYFVFSQTYGSNPHYFIDERVRYQANLFAQKEYVKYLIISILSFGTFIPPMFIPYPVLNFLREFIALLIPLHLLKVYLFSIAGSLIFIAMSLLAYLDRKKSHFKILLFSLVVIFVPVLFYSASITMDERFFLMPYQDDANRWRYFSFFGVSLFLVVYFGYHLRQRLNRRIFYIMSSFLIVGNLLIQVGFIWQTEDRMYEELFREQKLFYKTILSVFPTYSEENVIYYPPRSYRLGDYASEWRHLINFYYPNIKELPSSWAYSEMRKVLKLLNEGTLSLNKISFIDYNPSQGVVDYTKKAKKEIFNQKEVILGNNLTIYSNKLSMPVKNISPIEFTHIANITFKADFDQNFVTKEKKELSPEKLNALIQHVLNHVDERKKISVDVCGTYGNFLIFNKNNILDGNFGLRSYWNVDCFPGWFIYDLGAQYEVSGFLMSGFEGDSSLPRLYSYEVSNDGQNWEKVMKVKDNSRWDIMDKWPKSYLARYIRINLDATQKFGFPNIDEAEPVFSNEKEIFTYWDKWASLRNDMYNLFKNVDGNTRSMIMSNGLKYSFGRLSWKTNLSNIPEDETSFYFPFVVDGEYHTYKIPIQESEIYNTNDEFLKRKITDVSIDFSYFPGTIYISDFSLKPEYPVSSSKK